MCCTSAKSLLRLVLIGGLVLFGGSVRLLAEDASHDAPTAAEVSNAANDEHPGGVGAGHDVSVPLKWKGDLALFSLITFLLFITVLGKFAGVR